MEWILTCLLSDFYRWDVGKHFVVTGLILCKHLSLISSPVRNTVLFGISRNLRRMPVPFSSFESIKKSSPHFYLFALIRSRPYPRPFLFGGTGVLASHLPVSSTASAAGLGYQQLPNQRHFLQRIPVTGKKVKPQRRCIVCKDGGVRRESRFYCSACPGGPGFCRTGSCFVTHHRMMGCEFDTHHLIWRRA